MQESETTDNMNLTDGGGGGGGILGWDKADIDALMLGAQQAKEKDLPLKTVFESLALSTGRKPNSVRNYYYAMLKRNEYYSQMLGKPQAFLPFSEDEVFSLVKEVLKAQAKGESIRSCTLRLGKGDMKEMLRYQNKYRSAVKTNPHIIKEALKELQDTGQPYVNPYEYVSRRGRPSKKQSGAMKLKTGAGGDAIINILGGILKDLERTEDVNTIKFFEELARLTSAAAKRKGQDDFKLKDKCELLERALQSRQLEYEQLQEKYEYTEKLLNSAEQDQQTIKEQLEQQKKITMQLRGNMSAALAMLRQLVGINKEFLRMNSIIKMSNLTQYISELKENIDVCEKVVSNCVNIR